MSLDRLVEEIRARGEREAEAEQARVAAEKQKIAEDRDRRIRLLQEEIGRQATLDMERERVLKLAGAKLTARQKVFEAQEDRARESLEQVRLRLSEFTRSPEYPEVLRRMYDFASRQLGPQLKVSGRAEDATALKNLAGKGFVNAPLGVSGGFVAESPDGERRLNLTFEELLRLREDRVRALLKV